MVIALSDEEYVRKIAETGDPHAQYVHASYLNKNTPYGSFYRVSDETKEWILKSANQGYVKAQAFLCGMLIDRVRLERSANTVDVKWCKNAAEHNHRFSQAALGYLYYLGYGVPKNNNEAFFWMEIGAKQGNQMGSAKRDLDALVTDEEKDKAKKRIEQWEPKDPAEPYRNNSNNPKNEMGKATYLNRMMPWNIKGLLCGGEARGCKIVQTCKNMSAIICPKHNSRYVIVDNQTQGIISECPTREKGCDNFVPDNWSCEPPQNMPISAEERKKYPEYKNVVVCGDVLGIDFGSSSDGPYAFVSKKTGKKLGGCSFWNGKCHPPKEWTCGRPSNYGG